MGTFIKHIAGNYDDTTKLQICQLCGSVLWDNNGVHYISDEDPPKGWGEGKEVFVSDDSNGRLRTIAICDTDESIACTTEQK
jgi:hypothetical protein